MAHKASAHRWLGLIGGALVIAIAATALGWPIVVRHLAIARIQALTNRPTRIDSIHINPFAGRIAIAGLHILDRDGQTPFADVERIDIDFRPLRLLRGQLGIRSAVFAGPTVRVVRFPDRFNISDLVEGSGSPPLLDVSIERLAVTKGTVALEDRALAEPRTWRSENIEIEASNLSSRHGDGAATATSITAGAATSLSIRHMRLSPVHLEAEAVMKGLDISLARLYLPPDAPVTLTRGSASSALHLTLDARDGVRANGTGEIADVALTRPGEANPIAVIPKLTADLRDLVYQGDRLAVGRLELTGSASVRDPRDASNGRMRVSAIRARIADVTWPVTAPGRLEVESSIPGGGTLALTGRLRPPPAASQLRLRLAGVDLAPWTGLFPAAAGIAGVARADLRIDEPLAPGVPSRIQGSIAVNQATFRDGGRQLLAARRIEASGLRVHWPSRLTVARVVVDGPQATIERNESGELPLATLIGSRTTATDAKSAAAETPPDPSSIDLNVGQLAVKDGVVAWRDAVRPRVALDFTGLDAEVTGLAWPARGPLGIRAELDPPRGGQLKMSGRVAVAPLSAELRVNGTDVPLEPYQRYVPVAATIAGRTDFDLAAVVPSAGDGRARIRGSIAMSRIDVRDGERTVMRVERAAGSGVDIDWPRRIFVRHLALRQPWALFERNREGALALRDLLTPSPTAGSAIALASKSGDATREPGADGPIGSAVPITVGQLSVEDGGARIVDHHVTPPFALDLDGLSSQIEDLSTDPKSKPARIALSGRAGRSSSLRVHGTAGSLGGPLRLDLNGELQGFAVPPTSPYLIEQVAWEARDGWLSTVFRCRVDGDTLDARTEIRLSRLQVAKVGSRDQAQSHIGLPLGMIVALMKDRHGDIRVTLPVSGRLSDPRFDVSEAIWSTIRNVAVRAITAPVSWIGHVELDSKSRIQRIDVDPIPFVPGRATLTPEAQERVSRVAAFLEQAPEMRMALTPVVSSRDGPALRRRAIEAEISRMTRDGRLSREAAAAKLYTERVPQQPLPGTVEAIVSALVDGAGTTSSELSDLAAKRLEAVRNGIRKAGIEAKRLKEAPVPDTALSADAQVRLDLVEPDQARPKEHPNFFRRLFGQAPPPSRGSN